MCLIYRVLALRPSMCVCQALTDLLGFRPNALNGSSISALIPGPANIHHSSYMQHYKETHHASKVDKSAQETVAMSASGYGVPVRLEVTTNSGGEGLTGVFEEVSLPSCLSLILLSPTQGAVCMSDSIVALRKLASLRCKARRKSPHDFSALCRLRRTQTPVFCGSARMATSFAAARD